MMVWKIGTSPHFIADGAEKLRNETEGRGFSFPDGLRGGAISAHVHGWYRAHVNIHGIAL